METLIYLILIMPYDFHNNNLKYFEILSSNSESSIIPFLTQNSNSILKFEELSVLEIGCGEGGNLSPFLIRGSKCVGIDLNNRKIQIGTEILKEYIETNKLKLISEDLYSEKLYLKFESKFDLVILRDVIEHVHEKEKLLSIIYDCLKIGGNLIIIWPPWYMPFAGHQQICESKVLKFLPWFHLLPKSIYKILLDIFKEPKNIVDELIDIKDCNLSIFKFKKIIRQSNFNLIDSKFYFINPIYELKFNIKRRVLHPILVKLGLLKEVFTTSCMVLLRK